MKVDPGMFDMLWVFCWWLFGCWKVFCAQVDLFELQVSGGHASQTSRISISWVLVIAFLYCSAWVSVDFFPKEISLLSEFTVFGLLFSDLCLVSRFCAAAAKRRATNNYCKRAELEEMLLYFCTASTRRSRRGTSQTTSTMRRMNRRPSRWRSIRSVVPTRRQWTTWWVHDFLSDWKHQWFDWQGWKQRGWFGQSAPVNFFYFLEGEGFRRWNSKSCSWNFGVS